MNYDRKKLLKCGAKIKKKLQLQFMNFRNKLEHWQAFPA
jgi:hypothetical protein